MLIWVTWAVFAGVAVALGVTGYHFGVRTVRAVAGLTAVALAAVVTGYGLRHPAQAPPDLANAFTRGADQVAAALFRPLWLGHGVPEPGRAGWIVICLAIVLGYRELEAWALRWQAPVLDTSKLGEGQPSIRPEGAARGLTDGQRHQQLAAELEFRLAAIHIRSPSLLPGGSRTNALAAIAEHSGASGGGLAGAIIRFAGAVWPKPRRLRLQVWVESGGTGDTRVTVELVNAASGTAVATKTVAASTLDEAASMVAGYVARQVFARDPATPAWCYGLSDGRDLGVLQLARQERVDVAAAGDVDRSRREQIEILRQVTGGDRCAGLVRYELAQLHELGQGHVAALRLHALDREQYPRFFRGRYRLAMSLEMIANPGFAFPDPDYVRGVLDQVLGSLHRCGLAPIAECPPDGIVARDDGGKQWILSPSLDAVLLEAARRELRTIRRQLTFPAVAWATFRRRDERATWRQHWRPRVRQGFRDGADAGLLLVAVRQRLNGDRFAARGCRRALRIAAAVTGDSDPIAAVLRRPPSEWRLTGRPPRVSEDRVRWLPWLHRTVSWQAAYAVACLYSVLVQQDLAREDRIVASLRQAVGNRSSEIERPYDWISHDPDFGPLQGPDPGKYPAFTRFLAEQKLLDYPEPAPAAAGR
ncbi:MAG: hypothetical protein J2P25_01330 [Nocardiopsaceae bacterium]|nr:hypothetical protein [Nocardiopsaceae bacterium]